ncbi:restriction endonuclease subunit S [Fictibacillus phosphorivorans]|uniref:restriction endonuclease subunit S n=1 Tax=Fictibacillus phosphorivorans TaxID=1221500 RepID=UPI003CE88F65
MENNLPEVRFPEFSESWNKVKLGDVFEQTSEYVNPKTKNLELWSLTVEKGLTPKTDRYNREFLVKKEDQFKAVSNNEFIYNPMNMTLGAVDLNLTGKQVAVSGYYTTMKTTDGYNSNYFNIWLKSPLAIKMYKAFATGSLIEKQRVQFPTLSQIKASVPLLDEQTKLGDFFKHLDQTIAFHTQELTTLKQTKQGFLQKMFPKEGESVPKVRFSEFTESWVQSKLGEISNIVTGSTPSTSNKEYYCGNFLFVSPADMQGNRYVDATITTLSKKGFDKGRKIKSGSTLFVSIGSTIGKVAQNSKEVITNQQINSVIPSEEMDEDFVFSLLEKHSTSIKKLSAIQAVPIINKNTFSNINIMYPTLEEQIKIGNFFKQFDDVIALHQRKLDALKETKKAFLQKMFV